MENKKLGALAFLPLLLFLGTYIGCGIVFSVMGADSPFGYFPRHVALLVGIASALILAPVALGVAEGCGSEMRDKFRMNFFIAFPAAILSMIFYGFIGGAGSGSMEVGAFDLFQIAPKRLASLVDIFACAFLAVMPHDGGMLMTSEMANISPFAILPYSIYPLLLVIATCVTIQAGLLRTPEEK